MKRNIFSTIFEIIFPIALILLCYIIRQAFQLEKYYFNKEETDIVKYIKNTSTIYQENYVSPAPMGNGEDSSLGLTIIPALKICAPWNEKFEPRPVIASIGLPEIMQERIKNESGDYKDYIKFKEFDSVDDMNNAVKDKAYGKEDNELICFGVSFKQEEHNYDYSLHYFDSLFRQ